MGAGVQCDVCKRFVAETEIDGWMVVSPMTPPGSSNTWMLAMTSSPTPKPIHACSWACVGLLAINMPEFANGVE